MEKTNSSPEMVYGVHPVLTLLETGREIEKIWVQKGQRTEQSRKISAKARALGVPVLVVPVEKLNRLTRKNHQGVVAMVSAIQYASLDHVLESTFAAGNPPFLLLLDQVSDVRNFGAIARVAACAGVDALVLPAKGGALINSDAVKTSAGALHHLPVCRVNNLVGTVQYLKDSGLSVVAASERGEQSLFGHDFKGPLAIVMGAEDKGVSAPVRERCHAQLSIPLAGGAAAKIGSLNVATAAAVFAFEVLRQRSLQA